MRMPASTRPTRLTLKPSGLVAANAAAGVDQLGGWVFDDGFKVGIGCQDTLLDRIV